MVSELESITMWLNGAESNIAAISIYKQNGSYHFVVFNLQQAEELAGKATMSLMNLARITDNPESKSTKDYILQLLGMDIIQVKDYGHNWHEEFLKQLKKIYSGPIFRDFLSQDLSTKADNLIYKAISTNGISNPKIEDVEQLILICNNILDIVDKNNFNDLLEFSNNSGGIPLNGKKLSKGLVNLGFFEDNEEANKTLLEILEMATVLIVLAILDVYLGPHYDARYFPDTKEKVLLDEKFPLIIKSDELAAVLKRCINLDKRVLSNRK